MLHVAGVQEQAYGLLEEIQRLQRIEGGFDPDSCAVLAREWKELDLLRSVLEANGLAVNLHWGRGGQFPGLHRIRENALLLERLRKIRGESRSGSELLEMLPAEPSRDNLWHANLRRLIQDWVAETNDNVQPVVRIEEYFYEVFADQRRSRNLGCGIYLSTVHSVKGLEFDHVFLLGEHWPELPPAAAEEERRLYYVAMTRARETLQLFAIAGMQNPHVAALSGDCVVQRRLHPVCDRKAPVPRHVLLGMEDLFLDFAGVRSEDHPVRLALTGLNVGDTLHLAIRHEHLELINAEGLSVARLSRSARQRWGQLLHTVQTVRVVAMVRRYREHISDERFQRRCLGAVWEVPLLEICCREEKVKAHLMES